MIDNTTMQSSNGVTYRPVVWSDVDAIVREFDRTWGRGRDARDDAGSMRLSRHFVMHYLEPTTRGEIAEAADGTFLGVTLSRVVGDAPLFADEARTGMAQVDAELRADSAWAPRLNDTLHCHAVEEDMEAACGVNDSTRAEVELFLVAAAARGHGVGGTLWRRLMDHFDSRGVGRYYLHTDSSCDIGFYEHKGLVRVAERLTADHRDDPAVTDDVFIYTGTVEATASKAFRKPGSGTCTGTGTGTETDAAHTE